MRTAFLVVLSLVSVGAAGCAPDVVAPGYYAAPDDGSSLTGAAATSGTMENGITASAGTGAGGDSAGSMSAAGTGASLSGAGTGAMQDMGAAGTGAGGGGGACDMSGRWLVTRHVVVDGLGQLQTSHTWLYYEIAQSGDQFTVTKGLNCGHEVVTRTALGANADMHLSWPSVLEKGREDGRGGTSKVSAGGCDVHFDKITRAEGVSVPHYNDLSVPLPMMDQQAMGATPGWEDWDGDGNPGITMILSGGITGELYAAIRSWSELSGAASSTQQLIKLSDTWNQEENVLGYNGSPLLTSQGVRAADATLHFAELARLRADQGTGDDTAICAAMRMLAKTLTPNAAAN